MKSTYILLPSVGMMLLTFSVLIVMFRRRVSEMKLKKVHPRKLTTAGVIQELLPESVSASSNLTNLFEFPVIFYMASIALFSLGKIQLLDHVLVWAFFLLRVAHSYIHITYNNVMHRFRAFGFSILILLIIVIRVLIQLI